MNEAYIKEMYPEVRDQKMQPCKECMIAKSAKSRVKKQSDETTKTGELGECVASDLKQMFGPGSGGKRWMGSAIETTSRYAVIVCTATKGEFADHWANIVKWFKTQLGKPFKIWRTDGGKELDNHKTDQINREEGIQHSVTAPNSSKKNPIAERWNRTAGEGIAAMLLTAMMTTYWWVEAAQYWVYIYNRTPHRALGMKTPYEKFYGKKPHKVRFIVFGCLAFVHDEHRKKSSMFKARAAVFIGIDSSGRYKFVDLVTGNRFTSDSARFVQNVFPLSNRKLKAEIDLFGSRKNEGVVQEKKVPVELPAAEQTITRLADSEPYGMDTKDPEQDQEEEDDIDNEEKKDDDRQAPASPTPQRTPSSPIEKEEKAYDGQQQPRSPKEQDPNFWFSPGSAEECITNEERRYPTRIRQPSLGGLESIANTPPPTWKVLDRLDHRAIEAIANAILYDAPVPNGYAEAVLSPEWPLWQKAILKEVQALIDKGTFEEAQFVPTGRKALRCRWVFKIKPETAHEPKTYKARLVVQGYRQKEGVDFEETFAAVARTSSLRVMLALAAAHNTRITKLDVANAFLASTMDVELYVHTPEGYPSSAPFLKLLKALYGLKQAPRLWYGTLIAELESMGFKAVDTDSCVFKHQNGCTLVIVVDDMLMATNDEDFRTGVETRLDQKFKIKAFGDVKSYIGLDIEQTDSYIKLTQSEYIDRLLERFGMLGCKPAKTPAKTTQPQDNEMGRPAPPGTPYRQLVGALLYLFATRPDICVSVVKLSTRLENPTEEDWKAAKRVLRYLAGTKDKGIVYPRNVSELKLWARSDSDWAGCKRTRRSTSGYAIFLGSGAVAYKSKMQSIVALSSCEAEYIALVECIREIIWLVQHLQALGAVISRPVVVGIDNQAAIALAKNPVLHEKTKHIDTRHHFIRQAVSSGLIRLVYVNTKDNVADILTKNTGYATFSTLSRQIVL